MVTERFVWSEIRKDCAAWTKRCVKCKRVKIIRHTKNLLVHFDLADARIKQVHLDLIGSLPSSRGNLYCLTA